MRRLYFLVPDIPSGKKVVDELLLSRVEWKHMVAGGGILLATSLAGIGVGAYLGGMVGLNVGNTRLKAFEQAVEAGKLLFIVDVPRQRVEEITERLRRTHPEVDPQGTEPRVFP